MSNNRNYKMFQFGNIQTLSLIEIQKALAIIQDINNLEDVIYLNK